LDISEPENAGFEDIPKNRSIMGITDPGGNFYPEENSENRLFSFYSYYYF
jgi:hypothetical protein